MMSPEFSIDEKSWRDEWLRLEMEAMRKVAMLLEVTGAEAVAYLRSLTSQVVPAARSGEGERRAHPGGWADITGNLANAYAFEVLAKGTRLVWSTEGPTTGTEDSPVGVEAQPNVQGSVPRSLDTDELILALSNSMDYAAALEAKDGYYILTGLADAGGPLESVLAHAATLVNLQEGGEGVA